MADKHSGGKVSKYESVLQALFKTPPFYHIKRIIDQNPDNLEVIHRYIMLRISKQLWGVHYQAYRDFRMKVLPTNTKRKKADD